MLAIRSHRLRLTLCPLQSTSTLTYYCGLLLSKLASRQLPPWSSVAAFSHSFVDAAAVEPPLAAIADEFDEPLPELNDDEIGPDAVPGDDCVADGCETEFYPFDLSSGDAAAEVVDPAASPSGDVAGDIVTLHVRGGRISFHPSKGDVEAVCNDDRHKGGARCVITRQCARYKRETGELVRGGRPLGLMAAWLSRGCDGACISKDSHRELIAHISFEERYAGRLEIASLPGYDILAGKERGNMDDSEFPFEPLLI